MRTIIIKLLLILASTVAALAAAEWLLRAGHIPTGFMVQNNHFMLDRELLYRHYPGGREDIDQHGFRKHGRPAPGAPVLLLGDSFAFGVNVTPEQSIAGRLSARQAGPVINAAVSGYGPDQSLLMLRRIRDRIQPGAIVLTLFPANDFNDLSKNALFDLDENGRLIEHATSPTRAMLPRSWLVMRLHSLIRPLTEQPDFADLGARLFNDHYDLGFLRAPDSADNRHKLALLQGVLAAFKTEAQHINARLLVVVIPSYEQFSEPMFFRDHGIDPAAIFTLENLAATASEELGIDTLNLAPLFQAEQDAGRYFDRHDHHLSPAGYQRVAGEILRRLNGH